MRRLAPVLMAFVGVAAACCVARLSFAQDRAAQTAPLPADAHIEFSPTPVEGKTTPTEVELQQPPPVRPHAKGLVLEMTAGVLGYTGLFRHLAPPAYWTRMQVGFEILSWLMVLGDAELGFTDTSESQDEAHTIAFPIWGFGGGLRATMHPWERVAVFVQGEVGALSAVVPHNALAVLGFRQAEGQNLQTGGRLGLDWYQKDRHLAFTLSAGARWAGGFQKVLASSDLPFMWDGALGLRYAF